MGASAVPFVIFTLFWGVIGGVLPWFVPAGINKGVIQTMLVLTAVCCYLFWLCCYMSQMNPLIGPQLTRTTLAVMKEVWK
ncbi:v-type proton ATPase subunit e 2 [Nephila pilipes]|uniref:V-type proton ATPase subunit e 2 n=1 Tax=Nephila pilipes TaxID=299642 RepID=A0A8X6IWZ9_NEPPI|nr:v-type proton ATPase subunit e 2 [Nephila pilipes]